MVFAPPSGNKLFLVSFSTVGRLDDCEAQLRQCFSRESDPDHMVNVVEHCLEIADGFATPTEGDRWVAVALDLLRRGNPPPGDARDEFLKRVDGSEPIQSTLGKEALGFLLK